ncbi:MAG: hypothetical protein U0103_02885 [Candidatus Obscuribacterales bacterium]
MRLNKLKSRKTGETHSDRKRRTRRGVGLIEAIVMAIVLIPVTLFFLDLIVLVLANWTNDAACKNAARVAANQRIGDDAVKAAERAINSYRKNSIVKSIRMVTLDYDEVGHTIVAVQTELVVHLPVPVPGYSDIKFIAKDVEPILVK